MPLRKPTANTMEQSVTRIQHVQHENVKDINKDLNATSNLLIIIKGKYICRARIAWNAEETGMYTQL